MKIDQKYYSVRAESQKICRNLSTQQMSTQPRAEVSPPKWHLGHTSWFFEKFILTQYLDNYQIFNDEFHYIFNSYYKAAGKHFAQAERGSIPVSCDKVNEYRNYVDFHMKALFETVLTEEVSYLIEVGLNHEEQHQELLYMDIKVISQLNEKLNDLCLQTLSGQKAEWFEIKEGLIEVGHGEKSFSYDNEQPRHKRYQYNTLVSKNLVTRQEYKEFIEAGGYENPILWLSKGWDWVCKNKISSPLYWEQGNSEQAVSHISYFEADAYANFMQCRLPTEFEHELLDNEIGMSELWCWTSSQYSPYPGYKKFDGVLAEYNGKFMCNQFVLKGGCMATPKTHWRSTYRNFYEPHQRWMFSGIRLAKDN